MTTIYFSECTNEAAMPERLTFTTASEAISDAKTRSQFDEATQIAWEHKAFSQELDDDGDPIGEPEEL